MRRFAVPSAVLTAALAALLACSGAEPQDVLSSQIGNATSSGASGQASSGTSGTSGTSSGGTSGTSGTTSGAPPPPSGCMQETEDNDSRLAANEFSGAICGHLGEDDNDDEDHLTFTIPPGARSTSFGFEGNVRVYLSGPGAEELEYRPGRDLNLRPGTWFVRLEIRGNNGGQRVEWRVFVTSS